jgi:AraC-like DNA-binding protein
MVGRHREAQAQVKPIPLISTEIVGRIATLLDAAGIPADRYLERSGISPGIREDPAGFVPGRCVWRLVGLANDGEGLDDFWVDIARLADWRRAGWVRPLTHAVSLGDAIRAMCWSYVRQIPMNDLGLTRKGSVAWFWRRRTADTRDWEGGEPAEMYTLSFMLEVVRAAAGPGWLPERLEVQSPPSGWTATSRRIPGVRVEHDQPLLAMAIPAPLLSLPVTITTHSATGLEAQPPATDFQGSLRQVLEPLLTGGLPGQEAAAEMLWTSPRTLRRRLAEEGSSWHAVINDLKFRRAIERLQAGASVREVAEELGYSDAAHFTRFFRLRAGVPPSGWRRHVEHARELTQQAPS